MTSDDEITHQSDLKLFGFLKTQEARELAKIVKDYVPGLFAYIDENLVIRFVNSHYEEVFERPVSQVAGLSPFELTPLDSHGRLLEDIRRAQKGEVARFRATFVLSNPSKELHLNGVFVPHVGSDKQPHGFFVFIDDITDLEQAQSKQLETESFLRAVVDASPNPVVSIDRDGRIISFSREASRVFGYSEKEVVGQNVSIIMPEPDRSHHDAYLVSYLKSGKPKIIGTPRVVRAQRKNGDEFPARLFINEFHDGGLIFVGFIEDVTQELEADLRLAEVQSELQQFGRLSTLGEYAGAIAHEVGQPLTGAASLVEATLLTLKSQHPLVYEELKDNLSEATTQIQRASEIIRRMRELIRHRTTQRLPHRIDDVIEEACLFAFMGIESENIQINKKYNSHGAKSLLDRIQIQQVIINIIRNAVDAMSETTDQKLTISTETKGDFVTISIADTGPGISDEIAARLFQPLVTSKPQGLGMGLSLSKNIIDAHQGEISFASNNGKGTVFDIHLPIYRQSSPTTDIET